MLSNKQLMVVILLHSRPKTTRIGLFNSGPEKVNWIMTSLCLNPMDYAPIDLLLQDYSPTLTLLKIDFLYIRGCATTTARTSRIPLCVFTILGDIVCWDFIALIANARGTR